MAASMSSETCENFALFSGDFSHEKVEIRHIDERKGKGLFAVTDLKEGGTIFTEAPLVSVQFAWNALYKYAACDFCLKSMETAEEMCRRLTGNQNLDLPHAECCTVNTQKYVNCETAGCMTKYCSTECRQAAWRRYHRTLCMGNTTESQHPLLKLDEFWRNMHYPPETANIMLIARIVAMVNQADDKAAILSAFSRFCHSTSNEWEEINHKLLGENFKEQQEMLRQLLVEALPTQNVQQQWFTPEGFQSLLAMIGTNGQGIGSSSFSVWVKNCEKLTLPDQEKAELDAFIDKLYEDIDKVVGPFMDCEGSGLYSTQSAINHSCSPNAEITFPYNDHTLVLVATEDIPCGQEICISYLDECNRDRSRHSRQKLLRENYLFNCACVKCQNEADEPDVTSDEDDDSQSDCMDSS